MEHLPFYRTPYMLATPMETGIAGKLEYFQKKVYGVQRFYLSNKVQAAAVYDLTGTKTILPMHMHALHALGFELKEVAPPLSE